MPVQEAEGFVYSERITLQKAWNLLCIPTNLLAILQVGREFACLAHDILACRQLWVVGLYGQRLGKLILPRVLPLHACMVWRSASQHGCVFLFPDGKWQALLSWASLPCLPENE
jgi:hypothetical protein